MSERRSMTFPADVAVLASVRSFAATSHRELGAHWHLDDVVLVVAELAANAAVHQHAEGEVVLTRLDDDRLQIEVADGDPTVPTVVDSEPGDVDGHRGLYLVAAISESWGVEVRPGGKRVWAVLARVPDRPSSAPAADGATLPA